ncbi:cytochrome o ubiquinol oxidase operon protein cyoD [Sphingomonas kyeonggiensis]|uniref:Cytochrome bo(3) ubiquinol oxidase subunit 4 n=1 Tax=Sphingomonas kyeonggiensis TaxID=1268553 RepID=A0A7W7K3W7_9SPHN|nr:cytochrome o ubiquinol oxidase subunit IV [Sphingomonas kyeonggiensis]MBB4840237.1 cytochrome o ubiquinol oxidase operon protein cyoD [Sphingomonas kyeonggiensis]
MSHDPHAHDAHAHGDHGDHGHGVEIPHGSMRDYVIGFVLSVILTAIPFYLVMERPFSNGVTAAAIMAFAMVQIVVHMVYFLHLKPKAEGGWTMTALLFTIIVVVIMLSGSLWVMYHLNANMMPMVDPSQLP